MELRPARASVDLVLLDPPYDTGAGQVALHRLQRLGWIGPQSWMALETGADEDVAVTGLAIHVERRVGRAKLTLLHPANSG